MMSSKFPEHLSCHRIRKSKWQFQYGRPPYKKLLDVYETWNWGFFWSTDYESELKVQKLKMANQNEKLFGFDWNSVFWLRFWHQIRHLLPRNPPSTKFHPNELSFWDLDHHIESGILNLEILSSDSSSGT